MVRSKLIHNVCFNNVRMTGGSKNQPFVECQKCGLINYEELNTLYQCSICGQYFSDDTGKFDVIIDKNTNYGEQVFHCVNCMSAFEKKCILCNKIFNGYGNNPEPLSNKGMCCDICNDTKVIPARLNLVKRSLK